jgi:hypothetical protein
VLFNGLENVMLALNTRASRENDWILRTLVYTSQGAVDERHDAHSADLPLQITHRRKEELFCRRDRETMMMESIPDRD